MEQSGDSDDENDKYGEFLVHYLPEQQMTDVTAAAAESSRGRPFPPSRRCVALAVDYSRSRADPCDES